MKVKNNSEDNLRKRSKRIKRYGPFTDPGACDSLISFVNGELLACKEQIDELEIPDFGSSLFDGDSVSCVFNHSDTIISSTVADRFSNKFERPNRKMGDALRASAISDWIKFERDHLSKWSGHKDHITRSTIYRSRELIRSWLLPKEAHKKSFWNYLEDAPINFGPGESFNPSQGDVSEFSKLRNLDNWTVTVDAAPAAAAVIATNKGLRVLVENYLYKKRKFSSFSLMSSFSSVRPPMKPFRWLTPKTFAKIVLHKFLYERPPTHPDSRVKMGARGTSVYKNTKKRRFINIECFLNVILEMMIGFALRMCLKHNAKNCLDTGQDRHRSMLIQPRKTTLDESNASDSIHHKLTTMQLPQNICKLIDVTRAPFIQLHTPYVDTSGPFTKTEWHPVVKTSSMGNGYTFELLTLTLLSVVRLFDMDGSVYGDDIICSDNSAEDIKNSITAVGFIINEKKSFIAKPLRESCGAYYLENYGKITCYDIKWCSNINDVIQSCNKLGRIVRKNKAFLLTPLIEATHARILAKIPALLKGPIDTCVDLPNWVEDARFTRSHMSSKLANQIWRTYSKGSDEALNQHWQLTSTTRPNWVVCLLPEPKKRVRQRKIVDDVRSPALIMTYIKSGMVTDQLYRVQKEDQEWTYKPVLVSTEGHAIRAATARRIAQAH